MKLLATIQIFDEEVGGHRPSFRMVLSTVNLPKPVYAGAMATPGASLDIAARYICSEIYNRDTAVDLLPITVEVEDEQT